MVDMALYGQTRARSALSRIADFLEYLLMLTVLLECNSMYTYAVETVGRVDMYLVFYRLSILLAAMALGLRLWMNPRPLKRWLPNAVIIVSLVIYTAAFYILNARAQEDWKRESFILNFLLFLPLMTALFKAKQREGQGLDLLLKLSDIVCVLAALSLVVYIASVLRPDSVQADAIYSSWNNREATTMLINFLDVCQSVLRAKWALLGVTLLRNRSVFTEPLMFALPLLIALYTELFLRSGDNRWRVLRWLILTAALVSASATIALMLMAAAWGLKGASVLMARGRRMRWLVIAVLIVALVACGMLVLEKARMSYQETAVSGTSMSMHLDDYRASFVAFRSNPVLGVGYLNEQGIFDYMLPYRMSNPGLSNTAGTVLAEGGLMLGLLCTMPFLIFMLYLFRHRDGKVACWGLGAFGAYAGIIFKYHLLLMLLIAFGYSLIDLRRPDGRIGFNLVDADGQRAEMPLLPEKPRAWWTVLVGAVAVALINLALALFGAPVWKALHTFLRGHQFSVGLAPLRSFCFAIVLLTHGVALRQALRKSLSWFRVALLLVWDAMALLLYPLLFSGVNTLLTLLNLWGELRECTALLLIWLMPAACVLIAPAPKRWLCRQTAALAGAVVAVIAMGAVAATLYVDRQAKAEDALVPELEALAEHARGNVYTNDLPLLYHRRVKGVDLPTTRDSGFEVEENVSIVFGDKEERRELMEYGFQVARLNDGHILYTNDDVVVGFLKERGTEVYRYYPFGTEVDLEALADLNNLTWTEDGALVVEGPGKPLMTGPDATLFPDDYTAYYALHIHTEDYTEAAPETQVCRVALTRYGGGSWLAYQPVALSTFDENGDAVVAAPFTASGIIDGVGYHLYAEDGFTVELSSIDIRHTPGYVTLRDYNSHRDVIRERYFNADGTPHYVGEYAVLEQEFDTADRLIGQRFCDAEGNPILVRTGYAELRYTHNAQGSPDSESYLGTDGEPIMISYGYASRRWEYDAYGNMAVTRYYDTEGNPVNNTDGYAVLVRRFDENRQVIEETHLDTEGNPVG